MAKKAQSSKPSTKLTLVARRELDVPEATLKDIRPRNLLLDPANLRLLESDDSIAASPAKLIGTAATQERVLDILLQTPAFEIEKLKASIIANTFLRHERLVVCPFAHDDYLVLEGNRRLSAVKSILIDASSRPGSISRDVLASIENLPCLVLDGLSVGSDDLRLKAYRRDATLYVGMRHLMGATAWEPASRYEFQARLIDDDKWTIEEVAKRFGRKEQEVIRDLAAHRLFRDFQQFRSRRRITEHFTYNIFAEAARSPAIMKWLEWSDRTNDFESEQHKTTFFRYVVNELGRSGDASTKRLSAEQVVRDLRDMLRLDDPEIEGALEKAEYDRAKILYDSRKEGKFHVVVERMASRLEQVRVADLGTNPQKILSALKSLEQAVKDLMILVKARKGPQ